MRTTGSESIFFFKWLFLLATSLVVSSFSVSAWAQQQPIYKIAIESDDIVSRTIFDHVGDTLDLSIRYVYYPSFSAVLDAIASSEADFAANVTYTPARAERFDYSSPTNIEYTYLFSLTPIQFAQVNTVGIPAGTIYGDLLKKSYPDIDQLTYYGTQEAKNLLRLGRVDAVVDAINQLKPMLSDGFDAELLNDDLSIRPVSLIVPKGQHTELLRQVEQVAKSADVQKALREQVQQYQFDLLQQSLRDDITRASIDTQSPLLVKLENLAPFNHYQANGDIVGITADVVMQSCDILQLTCQVLSTAEESWQSMYDDFKNGKIDLLGPLTVSQERQAFTNFVTPHYFPEAIMVKRKGYKHGVYNNVSELIVERIGVVRGDFFDELLSYLLPQKALHYFRNADDMVNALIKDQIDYIPLDRANYNFMMRKDDSLPIENDEEIGPFYRSDIALGLAMNDRGKALAPFFERALSMIDMQSIINRYDKQPNWRSTFDLQQEFSKRVTTSLIILFIVAVVTALYLNHIAKVDNLTGIYNRRALMRRFSKGIPEDNMLIYLDIDKFKRINDTYGHSFGDEVLKRVANQIRQDWLGHAYRIGGDEFVLIGRHNVNGLDTMLQSLGLLSLEHESGEIEISVSIGVVNVEEHKSSLDEVMVKADSLMYRMKRTSQTTKQTPLNEISERPLNNS
ncbi:diguanylate cyclase [Vibrio astriarenae]